MSTLKTNAILDSAGGNTATVNGVIPQAALGFIPVEQGGGTDMGTNKVRIGWRTDATGIQAQVDSTVIGVLALRSDATQVLLGTLTTTSGNTQTLSGLNLTGYKELRILIDNVGMNAAASLTISTGGGAGIAITVNTASTSQSLWGMAILNLATGMIITNAYATTVGTAAPLGSTGAISGAGKTTITNATTTITFGGVTFDSGTIQVWGVK